MPNPERSQEQSKFIKLGREIRFAFFNPSGEGEKPSLMDAGRQVIQEAYEEKLTEDEKRDYARQTLGVAEAEAQRTLSPVVVRMFDAAFPTRSTEGQLNKATAIAVFTIKEQDQALREIDYIRNRPSA